MFNEVRFKHSLIDFLQNLTETFFLVLKENLQTSVWINSVNKNCKETEVRF